MTPNNVEKKSYQDGLLDGRAEGRRVQQIDTTRRHLATMVRRLGITLEEAMDILELPGKERKTQRNIFTKRQPKSKYKGKSPQ